MILGNIVFIVLIEIVFRVINNIILKITINKYVITFIRQILIYLTY